MESFRSFNQTKFGHIFSSEPMTGLRCLNDDYVEVYDGISCTYIGLVPKRDLLLIVDSYAETPYLLPHGDNDIPFCIDDFQAIPVIHDVQFSESFVQALRPIIDSDYLMELQLRWVPKGGIRG